jgi:hypothetical protein
MLQQDSPRTSSSPPASSTRCASSCDALIAREGFKTYRNMNEQDARILRRRPSGLVGSAVVRDCARWATSNLLLATRAELDLTRQAAVEQWYAAHRPEVVIMAAAQGRRHPRQRHLSGRVHPRQPRVQNNVIDAAYRHGTRKLTVSRLELHLSEAGAAADERRLPADRSARAHQRVVRDRQDRRHQDVPGLPPPVRLRCDLADADQSLRAGR